jgi:ABC-2 type transport system permease protein
MKTIAAQTLLIWRNDVRLAVRHFTTGRHARWLGPAALLVIAALLCAGCVALFLLLRPTPGPAVETLVWALIAFLMFGACTSQTIALFHERSDFDLLFSAPLRPASILMARLLAVAFSGLLTSALVFAPLWLGAMAGISWRYVSAFPVWLALAFLVCSVSIAAALALVRLLGPRSARTWMQVLGAVVGASIYLVSQAGNLIPYELGQRVLHGLARALELAGFPLCSRAGHGDWLALGQVVGVAALAVTAVLFLLDRLFVRSSQEILVAPSRRSKAAAVRFRNGVFAATLAKDLRLIARDPLLLSQLLPMLFYLLPPVIVMTRTANVSTLAPLALVVAVQCTAVLASLAADGEECLDLIFMSPTPEERLRAAKAAAGAVLPVLLSAGLCVVVAFSGHPWVALITLGLAAANAAAIGWLAVTRLKPTARKDLVGWRNRRRGVGFGRGLLSIALWLTGMLGVSWLQSAEPLYLALGVAAVGVNLIIAACCVTLITVHPYTADPTVNPA